MKRYKPTAIDAIMAEVVNYGGFAMTRGEVYADMRRRGFDAKACDWSAFARPSITINEAAGLIPAVRFSEVAP